MKQKEVQCFKIGREQIKPVEENVFHLYAWPLKKSKDKSILQVSGLTAIYAGTLLDLSEKYGGENALHPREEKRFGKIIHWSMGFFRRLPQFFILIACLFLYIFGRSCFYRWLCPVETWFRFWAYGCKAPRVSGVWFCAIPLIFKIFDMDKISDLMRTWLNTWIGIFFVFPPFTLMI